MEADPESHRVMVSSITTEQRTLLPARFSVDPQERRSGRPFVEDTALKKPGCCSFVVRTVGDVVIC